jgi:hypothetical protein
VCSFNVFRDQHAAVSTAAGSLQQHSTPAASSGAAGREATKSGSDREARPASPSAPGCCSQLSSRSAALPPPLPLPTEAKCPALPQMLCVDGTRSEAMLPGWDMASSQARLAVLLSDGSRMLAPRFHCTRM